MKSSAEFGLLLTFCLLAAAVLAEVSPEDLSRAADEQLEAARREAAGRGEKHHKKISAAGEPQEARSKKQEKPHQLRESHSAQGADKRAALADFKRAALADFKRAALADFKRAALADFKRAALADFKRAALADFKRAALADFKRAALADFKRAALADFKRAALADFKRAALADFKRSQHTGFREREMSQHLRKHVGKPESEKRAYYWDVCSRWVNGHEKLYVCRKRVR